MRFIRVVLSAVPALAGMQVAMAEPTEIVVRVMAKDAKFIGTETGGVQVTLRDAGTGRILAQGLTAGTTGSTPKIMTDGHARRDVLSDDKSAKFTAVIDLQRPRLVTVTATVPTLPKAAAISVSATQWVLPGKPVNGGDGWVLEMPGFAIGLIEPLPAVVRLAGPAAPIPVKVKVTMQCGCPITPGGLWDANRLQVAVMLERNDKTFPAMPLSYAGQPSTFGGNVAISEPGRYTVDIYAYDPANGNTGLAKFKLVVK
jgi:hypothetical protein